MHTASRAAPAFQAGLTEQGAQKAARHLRALLGCEATLAAYGEDVPAGLIRAAEEVAQWVDAHGDPDFHLTDLARTLALT